MGRRTRAPRSAAQSPRARGSARESLVARRPDCSDCAVGVSDPDWPSSSSTAANASDGHGPGDALRRLQDVSPTPAATRLRLGRSVWRARVWMGSEAVGRRTGTLEWARPSGTAGAAGSITPGCVAAFQPLINPSRARAVVGPSVSYVDWRPPPGPRLCVLNLRGQPDQRRLVTETRRELNSDGQTACTPVKR